MSFFLVSFPHAVATYDDKIIVTTELDGLDVGVTRDGLPVVLKSAILFVVVIAKAARKIEMVVDAASLNLRSRRYDALKLKWVLRFVIIGKLDDRSCPTQGGSRIACIGYIELLTYQ